MSNSYFNFLNPFQPGLTIRSAQLNDLFTQLTQAFDLVQTDVGNVAAEAAAAAQSAADAAASAADAAASAGDSAASAADALQSANDAQSWAAGVNLPAIGPGDALKLLQVKADETGYQHGPLTGTGDQDIILGESIISRTTGLVYSPGIDLDTVTTPGLQPFLVDAVNPSAPGWADLSGVLVERVSGSIIQTLKPVTGSKQSFRVYNGSSWEPWKLILNSADNLYGILNVSEARQNVGLWRASDSPQPADRHDVYMRGSDVFNTGAITLLNDNWNLVSQGGDVPLKQGLCDFVLPSNGPNGPTFGEFTQTPYMCFLYFHGGHAAPQWITQVAVPAQYSAGYLAMFVRGSSDGGVTWSLWRDLSYSGIAAILDPLNLTDVIRINSLDDFPAPVAGNIILQSNKCYEINGVVNIGSNKITMGSGTALRGNGVSASQLVGNYGGLSDGLINSGGGGCSFDMMSIVNTHPTGRTFYLDVNGISGVQIFSISDCVIGGKYIGYFHGPEYLLIENTIFCGASGASSRTSFGLQVNNVGYMQCESSAFAVDNAVGCFAIQFQGIVSGYAKIYDSIFDLQLRGIVDQGSTISQESLIICDSTFFGASLPVTGFLENDGRLLTDNNRGLTNFKAFGYMYQANNALTTAFGVATPIKVAFTSTAASPLNTKFTHTSPNTLTYTGAIGRTIRISVHMNAFKPGGGATVITFYVRHNAANLTAFQKTISLPTNNLQDTASIELVTVAQNGDTFELWAETDIANNVTIADMQFLVSEV